AIRRIQQIGFKKAEVERYGRIIKDLLDLLPFGMSSTGPSVYTVTDSDARKMAVEVENYFSERGIDCEVIITKARNRGAEVEV
ncbi:MAG: hypothetical protein QXF29_05045, partial [Archaeoglobaceae archaeon]